jgi:hypothetical protein
VTTERLSAVRVVWHDAHSESGSSWVARAEIDREPCVVETVGWLIPDAKSEHLVIAQSWIPSDDHLDGVLSIPVGMVQAVHLL